MASANLEVIVSGNIENVRRSFQKLNGEMAGLQGRFTRAGGAFDRATTRYSKGIFKNLANSIGDVSSSLLPAAGNIGIFGAALSALPFGPVAGAALGLGAALILLRDNTSAAEVQARRLAAAQKAVGDAVDFAREAATDQQQRFVGLLTTEQKLSESTERVTHLRRSLAGILKATGTGSDQYRRTLLLLNEAELAASAAGRDHAKTRAGLLAESRKAAGAIPKEIASLRERKTELERSILAARTFGIGAAEMAKRQRELGQVTDQITAKLAGAAGRHREVGRTAKEMADALSGSAAPGARELRRQLLLLSRQEVAKANKIDGINAVTAAAGNAAAQVGNLIQQIFTLNRTPVRAPSYSGGRGRRSGGEGLASQELGASRLIVANRPRGTIEERVTARLAAGARDDTLQDNRARVDAEGAARAGGVTDPDAIRLRGERAVLARRQAEVRQRSGVVTKGLRDVRHGLSIRLRQRDVLYAKLRKVPAAKTKKNDAARKTLRDAIATKTADIDQLYGQEHGLMDEEADLAAEAAELGFDIQQVDVEISATPTSTSDVGGGGSAGSAAGGASAGEAAVALADLTPGTADDIATREGLLAERQAQLEQAKARGDNDAIVQLASSILSLMDEIARLRGAVTDNTAATQAASGSTAFQFRGQGYYLGMGRGQSSDSLLDVGVGV